MSARAIKQTILLASASSFLILGTGCSEEESSTTTDTTTTPALSAISSLPSATDTVASTTSSVASKGVGAFAATTGVKFATSSGLTWTNGTHSRALCESVSLAGSLFREAAQPDLIQCYIGAMVDSGLFNGATAFDGNEDFYELTGDPNMTVAKLKFKATKDSSGAVNSFEMFMCFGGTANAPVQDGYISQTIANGSSSITSVFKGDFNGNTFGSRVSVSGTLSGTSWTSKTITSNRTSTFGDGTQTGSFGEAVTLTQGAGSITIDGYRAGTFNQGGNGGMGAQTFSDTFFAVVQILGADKMSTFALGDGTAKYNISWSGDTNNDGDTADAGETFNSGDKLTSWNGDTRAPLTTASDGDFFATANAGTLQAAGAEPTAVTFSASETWDCTGTFTSADLSAGGSSLETAMAACDAQFGGNTDGGGGSCHTMQ